MENEAKECPYCGKKFFPKRKQIYCTYRCGVLYNQRRTYSKHEPRNCLICGEEYIPRQKKQYTCGKPECAKKHSQANRKYKYGKWEGLSLPEKKKVRTKMSVKQWNSLSASDRWELMNLTELSGEIARMFPGKSFAQVRTLKEQGKLPEDFGKDVRG